MKQAQLALPGKPEIVLVDQCPKCGGDPKWNEVFGRYWLVCSKCGFRTPKDLDFKRVIDKWNMLQRGCRK